jgi:hypothetical protein
MPASATNVSAAQDRQHERRHALLGRVRAPRGAYRATLAAVVALGVAYAIPIETVGWNQTSHYALIRALDRGTTKIDADRAITGDEVRFNGHWYSNKAPGFALWELPAYKALTATGVTDGSRMRVGGQANDRTLWLLGIWGTVLPAVLLLLMIRSVAERIEPGFGTAAAVTAGLATLLLPFSSLLFSHMFAAMLVFGAFTLLFHEFGRASARLRVPVLVAAGLLMGFAITTEYPSALVGALLGGYAMIGHGDRSLAPAIRRGLFFALGVAVGVVPLLLYNHSAFGSYTHIAYANEEMQQTGFFGFGLPGPKFIAQLLLSSRGLLILTPVVVIAALAIRLVHRRGWPAEAWLIGAICVSFLVYVSAFVEPFGGLVPGPRYLLICLPFLCVALAPAWREWPGPTLTLSAIGLTTMLVATMTAPMIATHSETGRWTDLLGHGRLQATAATLIGVHPLWVGWGVVILALGAAIAFAAHATAAVSVSGSGRAAAFAVATLWALVATIAPGALGIDSAPARRFVPTSVFSQYHPYGDQPLRTLALIALGAAFVAGAALIAAQSRRLLRPQVK